MNICVCVCVCVCVRERERERSQSERRRGLFFYLTTNSRVREGGREGEKKQANYIEMQQNNQKQPTKQTNDKSHTLQASKTESFVAFLSSFISRSCH